MNKKSFYQRGFTLIELLVVIAIIGILAVIGIGNFQASQVKARDAARKSDLRQITSALETYYNDKGEYPSATSGLVNGCANGTSCAWGDPFVDENGTIYMAQLPEDPRSGTHSYYYDAPLDGSSYQIYARLENELDRDLQENTMGEKLEYTGLSCGNGNCNFGLSSPNTTPEEGRSLSTF